MSSTCSTCQLRHNVLLLQRAGPLSKRLQALQVAVPVLQAYRPLGGSLSLEEGGRGECGDGGAGGGGGKSAGGGEGFFYGGYCHMAQLQEGEAQVMAANVVDRLKEFLVDTSASHHICHKREYFMDLQPLLGPLNMEQVQGTVGVTHAGTFWRWMPRRAKVHFGFKMFSL